MCGLNVTFIRVIKLWQPLCGWYFGTILAGVAESILAQRFSNYVSRLIDLSLEVARCVVRNVTTHNAIHCINTKIIMTLSIAEQHNLKLVFVGRGRRVWLACAWVMCSQAPHTSRSAMLFLFISFYVIQILAFPSRWVAVYQFLITDNLFTLIHFYFIKILYSHESVQRVWMSFSKCVAVEKWLKTVLLA
jgi:hypothetical protein